MPFKGTYRGNKKMHIYIYIYIFENPIFFVLYGRWGPAVGRTIIPRGVGPFPRPGKPAPGNRCVHQFGASQEALAQKFY